jgi:hypothetical protein
MRVLTRALDKSQAARGLKKSGEARTARGGGPVKNGARAQLIMGEAKNNANAPRSLGWVLK